MIELHELTPEIITALHMAVLERARQDIAHPNGIARRCDSTAREAVREEAIAWVCDDEREDAFSFAECCRLLGISERPARERMIASAGRRDGYRAYNIRHMPRYQRKVG